MAVDKGIFEIIKGGLESEPEKQKSNSTTVKGNNNTVIQENSGTINVNTKKIVRPKITPDERHITQAHAREIQRLIGNLAEKDMTLNVNGQGIGSFRAKYHKKLQNYYKVNSYLLIPREHGEAAIQYLQRQRVTKRKAIQASNPTEESRNETCGAIYTRAKQLKMEPDFIKNVLAQRVVGHSVESLKELSSQELQQLYDTIMAIKI